MGVKIRHGGRHWRPPEGHCYTGVMSTESTPPDPADLDDLSRREFLGHSAKNAAVAGATAAGVVAARFMGPVAPRIRSSILAATKGTLLAPATILGG